MISLLENVHKFHPHQDLKLVDLVNSLPSILAKRSFILERHPSNVRKGLSKHIRKRVRL